MSHFRFRGNIKESFRLIHSYFTCNVPEDLKQKVYNHRFARITKRDSRLQPTDPKVSSSSQTIETQNFTKSIRLSNF